MSLASAFLGGARSRLLPASVPFRFFGAAVTCQLLAWLALLPGADAVPAFAGGPGWPLAALHLVTLGVLTMTAIGASLQLLPVATRQPVGHTGALKGLWWGYCGGVAVLVGGMGFAQPAAIGVGAALVTLALIAYGALLARNLRGARGMPTVVVHGWIALAALAGALLGAGSLAGNYLGWALLDRNAAIGLHVTLATYGFMGMLMLGFAYILVPMFALSEAPAERPARRSATLAAVALAGGVAASWWREASLPLTLAAVACGGAALGLHVRLMLGALRSGMRRSLGESFVLVKLGWVLLAASLLLVAAWAVGMPLPRLATLFGVVLVGALLSFLLGMLSRIVPFLASMHAAAGKRGPPMPSTLTAQRPLRVHFFGHLAALGLLLLAVLTDQPWLVRLAALAGVVASLAFVQFFAVALRRMAAKPAPQAPAGGGGALR